MPSFLSSSCCVTPTSWLPLVQSHRFFTMLGATGIRIGSWWEREGLLGQVAGIKTKADHFSFQKYSQILTFSKRQRIKSLKSEVILALCSHFSTRDCQLHNLSDHPHLRPGGLESAWFFISLWWLLLHWLWINHLKSCLRKPVSEGGKKWTVTFPNHYVLRVSCPKRVLERCSDLKRILNEHTIFSPNAPHGKFITVCCWESNTIVFIFHAFCLRLRAILFLLQPTGVLPQ